MSRKAFNFYRSYYDVARELSEKDRAAFLWAICQRQFEGVETELNGLAKIAYISQKHNIDSQVFGYENKTNTKLAPTEGGSQGGSLAHTEGGSVQEKEKEKEEEKGELSTNIFNFKKSLLELCHDEVIVNDFMKVRKTKKATNTETAFNSLKNEIEKSGRGAAECLRICIERDWKGFKSDWLNKINENGKSTEQSIADWLNM